MCLEIKMLTKMIENIIFEQEQYSGQNTTNNIQ